jgi:hypothetical protein
MQKRAALAFAGQLQLPPQPSYTIASDTHAPLGPQAGPSRRSPEDSVSQMRLANMCLDSPALASGELELPPQLALPDEHMDSESQVGGLSTTRC